MRDSIEDLVDERLNRSQPETKGDHPLDEGLSQRPSEQWPERGSEEMSGGAYE